MQSGYDQNPKFSLTLPTRVALSCVKYAHRIGMFDIAAFRAVADRLYFSYKRYYEDSFHSLCSTHRYLFSGRVVIDVGAHRGYTTRTFIESGQARRVYAFEPHEDNFRVLEETVVRRRLEGRAVLRRALVGESERMGSLVSHAYHHGDHRTATSCFPIPSRSERVQSIPMISIDTLLARLALSEPVGFLKIDVQGFEPAVLAGASRALSAGCIDAVAVEYTPQQVLELGFDPAEVLDPLEQAGYALHRFMKTGVYSVSRQELDDLAARRGYVDVLALRGATQR